MQAISACDGRRQDIPRSLASLICLCLSAKRLVRAGTWVDFAMMATDTILKIRMRHFCL